MTYQNSLDYAKQLDQEDPISYLRNQFHIPRDKYGKEWLYFTGNSLGLQPKITSKKNILGRDGSGRCLPSLSTY